jgi:hypothetical protein
MLRTGARWRDCPPEYGSYTTIYNRFNRWSRQGIWLAMFKALTGSAALFGSASIDAPMSRRTVRQAAEKGGLRRSDRALARRPHDRDPRIDRRIWQAEGSARRHPLRQARQKLPRWRAPRRNRNLVDQLIPDPSMTRLRARQLTSTPHGHFQSHHSTKCLN